MRPEQTPEPSWWHQNLYELPPSRWMCCICFEAVVMDDLYRAPNGNVWDICKRCQADEAELMRRPGYQGQGLCQTCGTPTEIEKLNRINPPPFDELIVCDHCYEWHAWEFIKHRESDQ